MRHRPDATRNGGRLAMRLAGELILLLAFGVIAAIHTWPLAAALSTHVPGPGPGDNFSCLWNIWWMREALASAEHVFFHTDRLMAPLGISLLTHTHTALNAFVGATLLETLPPAEALNVIVLATVTLNGFAAYVLAREVSGDRLAAALAGLLFMLAPPLTARLMGHFNLLTAWPMVLACWALIRMERRPGWSSPVALGLAMAGTAYADYYLAVFFLVFAAVFAVTRGWSGRVRLESFSPSRVALAAGGLGALMFTLALIVWLTGGTELVLAGMRVSVRQPTNLLMAAWLVTLAGLFLACRPRIERSRHAGVLPRLSITSLVGAAGLALLLLIPMMVSAWGLWQSSAYSPPSYTLKTAPRGIDLATLVMGHPFHGLTGEAVRSLYDRQGIDPMESSAWLGLVPLGLALWTMRVAWSLGPVRQWTGIAAVFFVWAMGPFLVAFGANLGLVLPQALATVVPIVNNARVPGRALIMVSLALSVLAALGIQQRSRRRVATLAIVSGMAILESMAAPLPLTRLPETGTTVRWLAEQPPGAVLPVPFGVRDGFAHLGVVDHEALYLQSMHGHPLAGGFVARVPRQVRTWYERTEPFGTLLRLSSGDTGVPWPACETALDGLRRAGIRYIVVDRHAAPPEAIGFVAALPLERGAGDAWREAFVVAEAAACPPSGVAAAADALTR